ncbi:prephenate dehydratase [Bacillus taeanensis]|uniref:Prephenate dehydratase n=1 Tax=Bacillus taeanensis TaxID=273032 RepID=A0A366Y197_9BACI|nr:prephenate dehydratase [Bacillus taeanensis]RBW71608.1 prephenate dehydratase [Bacillus taeanensis]
MDKIGYLGPNGTFTEYAAKTMFPKEAFIPYKTIPNCIDAVMEGEIDFAVVPIENTIEGSVNLTIDYLLHEQTLPIVAEIVVPIEQHLMVHPAIADQWEQVEAVYSHPHAIAQCHHFLRNKLSEAELKYTNSTGSAAEWLKNNPKELSAAIANELAAKTYGLTIVQKNIHDFDNNHTKFVVLNRHKKPVEKNDLYCGDKTTFIVTLPSDYTGALHQVLSAFAWRKLNLSKIESRPMKTGLGNYFFIIDIEMKADDILIQGAKSEIEALGCGVSILGSYPCFSSEVSKKKVGVSS